MRQLSLFRPPLSGINARFHLLDEGEDTLAVKAELAEQWNSPYVSIFNPWGALDGNWEVDNWFSTGGSNTEVDTTVSAWYYSAYANDSVDYDMVWEEPGVDRHLHALDVSRGWVYDDDLHWRPESYTGCMLSYIETTQTMRWRGRGSYTAFFRHFPANDSDNDNACSTIQSMSDEPERISK
jgi:hypothetical protein